MDKIEHIDINKTNDKNKKHENNKPKKIKIPNKNWESINWIIQDNEIIIKKTNQMK